MEPWHDTAVGGSHAVPKRFRRLLVAGVAALVLAVPIAVSASHIFSDVPTSNTFHNSISTLYGARITGGCGGSKYCPNDPVTRGSMAAFLVRGLGRVGTTFDADFDDWTALMQPPPAPGEPHPYGLVAPLAFRHGGAGGGSGLVLATGTIQLATPEPGVCPCEVQAYLSNDSTGEFSETFFGMIGSEFAPLDPDLALDPDLPNVAYAETTMTMTYTFTVASGAVNDYSVAIRVIATTDPTVDVEDAFPTGWSADLQLIYAPFDGNGGNPATNQTQGQPEVRSPRFRH